MASFSDYVQDKLYNELYECGQNFLDENADKLDLGYSLRNSGRVKLEEVRVQYTKVGGAGNRSRFYVFLELDVETREASYRYDDYEKQTPWLLVAYEGGVSDELENVEILEVEDYTTKPKPKNAMDDELVSVTARVVLENPLIQNSNTGKRLQYERTRCVSGR